MAAPFRFGGFDDVRFEMLASAAGYNAYEAWGRWCKAGSECTKRGTRVVSEAMAAALFGDVDALLAAELGRRVGSGIELDLEEGSIEWYGELKAKRQKAGQVRAQMPRDAKGRLLPGAGRSVSPNSGGAVGSQHAATTTPACAGPTDQQQRAGSSAPDLAPALVPRAPWVASGYSGGGVAERFPFRVHALALLPCEISIREPLLDLGRGHAPPETLGMHPRDDGSTRSASGTGEPRPRVQRSHRCPSPESNRTSRP